MLTTIKRDKQMNYKRIYESLILRRKTDKLYKIGDGTVESHHIIPKCMGGSNNKDNIVNLYCKEHYFAHLLLAKIYKNTEHFDKLLFAL